MTNDIIAKLNSRDDTIAKLNSIVTVDGKASAMTNVFTETTYGRMRWFQKQQDEHGTYSKVLQQEVITLSYDSNSISPRVTKVWVEVPTEHK